MGALILETGAPQNGVAMRRASAMLARRMGGSRAPLETGFLKKLSKSLKKTVQVIQKPFEKQLATIKNAAHGLEKNLLRPVGAIAGQAAQVVIQKASELDANKTFATLAGAGVFTPQSQLDANVAVARANAGQNPYGFGAGDFGGGAPLDAPPAPPSRGVFDILTDEFLSPAIAPAGGSAAKSAGKGNGTAIAIGVGVAAAAVIGALALRKKEAA